MFENMLMQKREIRDSNLVIRLTESQKKHIADRAKEYGLNSSQFILSLVVMYESNINGGNDRFTGNAIAMPEKKNIKTEGRKKADTAFYNSLHEIGDSADEDDTPRAVKKTVKPDAAVYRNANNSAAGVSAEKQATGNGKKITAEDVEKMDDDTFMEMIKGKSTGGIAISEDFKGADWTPEWSQSKNDDNGEYCSAESEAYIEAAIKNGNFEF